jgi:hypothetical protein
MSVIERVHVLVRRVHTHARYLARRGEVEAGDRVARHIHLRAPRPYHTHTHTHTHTHGSIHVHTDMSLRT